MVDYISGGWCWLSNGSDYLKLKCEGILWTAVHLPEIEHYEGGINIGFDLSKYYIIIKLIGVWIESNADMVDFLSYTKTWQQANTLQVEIIRNSSNNKEKLDGTNTVFPVHIVGGAKDWKKMLGDQEKYRCESIKLEQSGTPS